MKHWLYTEAGRLHLVREYQEGEKTLRQVAGALKTYPNMVRRALLAHGLHVRDRAQAQLVALRAGRGAHPTCGRARSDAERQAISRGLRRARGVDNAEE